MSSAPGPRPNDRLPATAMDPYAAPGAEASSPQPAGEIDIARALAQGAEALLRNVLQLLAVSVLGGFLNVLSLCTCVGWIFVYPVYLHGYVRFLIEVDVLVIGA